MTAVSSSTSQTATTLAQALAKLAADEAAKAAAKIIAADQAAVTQFENSQNLRLKTRLSISRFRRRLEAL
jgi:hypothetical protein